MLLDLRKSAFHIHHSKTRFSPSNNRIRAGIGYEAFPTQAPFVVACFWGLVRDPWVLRWSLKGSLSYILITLSMDLSRCGSRLLSPCRTTLPCSGGLLPWLSNCLWFQWVDIQLWNVRHKIVEITHRTVYMAEQQFKISCNQIGDHSILRKISNLLLPDEGFVRTLLSM